MKDRYLKAIEWNTKNHSKMTKKDWDDFWVFEREFNAWARKLSVADREVVFTQIRAVSMGLKVFNGTLV